MEKLKYKRLSQQTAFLFIIMIKYEFVFMCGMFETAAEQLRKSRFVHKHMIDFLFR